MKAIGYFSLLQADGPPSTGSGAFSWKSAFSTPQPETSLTDFPGIPESTLSATSFLAFANQAKQ